ncbi:hypothetical protein BJV74DRAFT_843852, partial [Russula compacta]
MTHHAFTRWFRRHSVRDLRIWVSLSAGLRCSWYKYWDVLRVTLLHQPVHSLAV